MNDINPDVVRFRQMTFREITDELDDVEARFSSLYTGDRTGGKGAICVGESHAYVLGTLAERARLQPEYREVAERYAAELEFWIRRCKEHEEAEEAEL